MQRLQLNDPIVLSSMIVMILKIENLNHSYNNKNKSVLTDINFSVKQGESVVIIGSSGCGKSTLLKSINRLVEPVSGNIFVDGENILDCGLKKAYNIRGKIGMIFQNFNLIGRSTVLDNVLNGRLRFNKNFNTLLRRFSADDYRIVRESLRKVGLENYESSNVDDLSGGQKQRVAIARTLAQEPKIILADEPVSNLDPKLMKETMDLLKKICEDNNMTLISSLHFLEFAKRYGTRIIGICDGKIVFDGNPDDLTDKDIVDIYGKTEEWDLYGRTGF